MRVDFTDPHGRRLWNRVFYVIPALLLGAAVFLPLSETVSLATGILSVIVFQLLGVGGLRQRTARAAEITCGPGHVKVTQAGLRNQTIRAKDITGATTARDRRGILLTLQHRKRAQPITLRVAKEAEAEEVRHALGIGHGGFGTLQWRTHLDSTARAALVGRLLTAALGLVTLFVTLFVSHSAGVLASVILGQIAAVCALLGVIGLASAGPEPTVLMSAEGLRLKTVFGWFALPYEAIGGLEAAAGRFAFSVPAPYHSVTVDRSHALVGALSDHDGEVMMTQIRAASQRARGLGPRKNDVTGRLDVLRRNGESARDWLGRLDVAGQMLSAGPGYRGHTLEVEDLWAILEDPDAEADLRAAAARILRHAPNTRVRIDAAVAAVRDESTHRRMRIAVEDDLDDASVELLALEANERQERRVHHHGH